MQDLSLAKLDEVLLAIDAATTVQEIKSTIDKATAAEVYAKQAKLGKDIELRAAEYIVRAERRLGEMLQAAKAAGQIKEGNTSGANQYKSGTVPNENSSTFTLQKAGIDRKLSSRAQKIASISKDDFEKKVSEGKKAGKLTATTVMKPNGKPDKKPNAVPKRHDHAPEVIELHNSGATIAQIAKETGVGKRQVRHIVDRENIERGARLEPTVPPADLSLTAQQKLELAIKQHKATLDTEFHAAVNARVQEFLENTIGPILRKEQAEARRVIQSRKGVMDEKSYKKILSCLHPDWVTDQKQKERYEEAFRLFTVMKQLLLDEKTSPTAFTNIPKTAAEWDELKRKAKEQKQQRKSGTNLRKI